LNNYISLNLIPSPIIGKPDEPGGPTKLGYFPEWVVERIGRIQQLKAEGVRMSEIGSHFRQEVEELIGVEEESAGLDGVGLSYGLIEQIVFPAILVDQHWEIIWINRRAEQEFFDRRVEQIDSAEQRNLIRLLLTSGLLLRYANWREILLAHICLAKRDMAADVYERICSAAQVYPVEELRRLWVEAEPLAERPITQQQVVFRPFSGSAVGQTLFSCDFREGTLLLYSPASMQLEQILDLLMGRERLIKALLSRRIPSRTPLCVLVARLDSALHLRTALPPHEYFDLLNQVILASYQCFKDHAGTPGRSFEETVVCFFLPSPESPQGYFHQALQCARAMQKMISAVDRRWQRQKNWGNQLRLNMGIHCGEEWLGTIPSSLAFEFTVMGETLVEAIKLSEFAQPGSIWASKAVIENLLPEDRQAVEFGIQLGADDRRFVSPGIYSQPPELLSYEELERRGLQQISNLAVTEIINLQTPADSH
jgi:class 3 adenylate cyclase